MCPERGLNKQYKKPTLDKTKASQVEHGGGLKTRGGVRGGRNRVNSGGGGG